MRHTTRLIGLGFACIAAACSGAEPAFAPEQVSLAAAAGPLRLTGSGHHSRTLGDVTGLTTFSFTAVWRVHGVTTTYLVNRRGRGPGARNGRLPLLAYCCGPASRSLVAR